MLPVVDSSLLTHIWRFWLLLPRWYSTSSPFHSCSSHCYCSCCCYSHCCFCFCCCHYFWFCSCLRCSLFAVLHYNTYRFVFNQSRIPFDAGGTVSSGLDSICSQGYVMDRFFAIQMSFLSWNQYFQCSIGNRVCPFWMHRCESSSYSLAQD